MGFLLRVGEEGYPFLAGGSELGWFLRVVVRGFVLLEDAREITVWGSILA
jgi:hypothetical protein